MTLPKINVKATYAGDWTPPDLYQGRDYLLEIIHRGAIKGRASGPHDQVVVLARVEKDGVVKELHPQTRFPYTLRGFLLNWRIIELHVHESDHTHR